MFLTELFGFFSLSALIMWAFLMAFFFNIFVYSLDVKRGTTLLLSSFIMMASYSSSDYFLTWLSIYNITYLDWVIYDLATIICLFIAFAFIRKTSDSFLYLIIGLSVNLLLTLSMHIDMFIYGNQEPWIFWDIYTISVFIIDLTMVVALIVDRDFLGLHKLKNKILNYFKSNDTHKAT
ncbi:hypothetical protein [Pseudoalteromonas sp. 31A1]|uniref:hypothetical protein n=1 Tax=Pseudoalteromonas sp. 31A1 TaxID=2686351 RepID=UPI0013FD16C3|nr:hypothetical protein [Pseudoalteromonas sp. 31A1]